MSGLSRADFEDMWERFLAEAQAVKFPQEATLRLTKFYRGLDVDDRRVVDEALLWWVKEGDPSRRFAALSLIDKFKIRSALPGLHADLARLEHAIGPSVPLDRAKLERIIAHLE